MDSEKLCGLIKEIVEGTTTEAEKFIMNLEQMDAIVMMGVCDFISARCKKKLENLE